MKKTIKKYRGLALLIGLFIFSLHINAVFEGRNEKLRDYTGVRDNVNVESYNAEQNAGWSIDDIKGQMDDSNATTGAPVSDSPWFFLLLGALGCGTYILIKNKKSVES